MHALHTSDEASASAYNPFVALNRTCSRASEDLLPQATSSGTPYFAGYFKSGIFGRAVRRAFFGKVQDDGTTIWDRASPEDLASLIGQDLAGQVYVEPVAIEPISYDDKKTGEVKTITSASVVRLGQTRRPRRRLASTTTRS